MVEIKTHLVPCTHASVIAGWYPSSNVEAIFRKACGGRKRIQISISSPADERIKSMLVLKIDKST
jgi:hypothetical protein